MKPAKPLGFLISLTSAFSPLVYGQWSSSLSVHPNSSIMSQTPFQVFRNIAISGGRVCSYYNQLCAVCQIFMSIGSPNGRFFSESRDAPIYYIAVDGTDQLSVILIAGDQTSISAQTVKQVSLPYVASALDIDYTHRWLVVSGPMAAMSLSLADPRNPILVSTVSYNRTGIGWTTRAISLSKNMFCASSGSSFFRCTDFKYGIISPAFRHHPYPYGYTPGNPVDSIGIRVFDDIVVIMGSGADWGLKMELYNRTTWEFLFRPVGQAPYEYIEHDVIRSSHFLMMTEYYGTCSLLSIENPKAPKKESSFGTEGQNIYQFMDETTLYVTSYQLSIITFSFPPGMNYSSFYAMSEFNGYGLAKPFLNVQTSVESIRFKDSSAISLNATGLWVTDLYMPDNMQIRFSLQVPLRCSKVTVDGQPLEVNGSFSMADLQFNRVWITPTHSFMEIMRINACYQGHCVMTEIVLMACDMSGECLSCPVPAESDEPSSIPTTTPITTPTTAPISIPTTNPTKKPPFVPESNWKLFTLIIWLCSTIVFSSMGLYVGLRFSQWSPRAFFMHITNTMMFKNDVVVTPTASSSTHQHSCSNPSDSLPTTASTTNSTGLTLQAGTSQFTPISFTSTASYTHLISTHSTDSTGVTLQAGTSIYGYPYKNQPRPLTTKDNIK